MHALMYFTTNTLLFPSSNYSWPIRFYYCDLWSEVFWFLVAPTVVSGHSAKILDILIVQTAV